MIDLNQQAATRIADRPLREIRQTLIELATALANETNTPLILAQTAIEQALLYRTRNTPSTATYWQQVYAARANGDTVALTQLKDDFAAVFPDAAPQHQGEPNDQ